MKVINPIGEGPDIVYVVEVRSFDDVKEYLAPTKVFLKEETAEQRKNALLEHFHDIKAKVVPVEVVKD